MIAGDGHYHQPTDRRFHLAQEVHERPSSLGEEDVNEFIFRLLPKAQACALGMTREARKRQKENS